MRFTVSQSVPYTARKSFEIRARTVVFIDKINNYYKFDSFLSAFLPGLIIANIGFGSAGVAYVFCAAFCSRTCAHPYTSQSPSMHSAIISLEYLGMKKVFFVH